MKTNFSTARNCAKSPLAKGAALLTALLLAASVQVKADTITNYDYVDDVIGNSSISGTPSDYGFGLKLAEITNFPGPFSGEITAWDPSNNSSYSDLYSKSRNDANSLNTEAIIGTALPTERQFNFSRSSNVSVFGIYSTSRAMRRNFRINSIDPYFNGPSLVNYDNIADGGTYTSLPSVIDSDGQTLGTGFSGNVEFRVDGISLGREDKKIYLSLERLSDGLYWSGTEWSHLRINRIAFGGGSWTSVGWPTQADLLNGQYRLRTMATQRDFQGSNPKGKLNTITFTIDKSAKTYYKIRNRAENTMYMYDGGNAARYNTLQAPIYSQTPSLFEWEFLPVSGGDIVIKNRATGDILNIDKLNGLVQCTVVPVSSTSMWRMASVGSSEYKRFKSRFDITQYFRLGYGDGIIHYDPVDTSDFTAHWSLEPFAVSSNSVSSASAANSPAIPSGGAS